MAIDSIIANIANASARVAGATRDAARPTGARFDDLLIAAPGNHPVSAHGLHESGPGRTQASSPNPAGDTLVYGAG